MARATKMSESPAPFRDDIYDASPPPSRRRPSNHATPSHSPSPATSVSSDKENRSSRIAVDKGKGRAPMGPPRVPQPNDRGKRKRGSEDPLADRSNRRRTVEVEEDLSDEEKYDPDQDIHERRQLRKSLRNLNKTLLENRVEFLNAGSNGIRDALTEANALTSKVKQTSDATIDSRLLVTAADYSYKKTLALISGDTAQGIDIDDFLSKCKQFMGQAEAGDDDEGAPSNTQRRRRAEEEEEDGEILNWAYLGRHACLKHNSRPSVPGFLLGPLSLEKRVRKVVARKAALRHNNMEETRPEILKAGDITKSENANLTTLCTQILARLNKIRLDARSKVESQWQDGMSTKEEDALMDRHGMSRDMGVALFKFVINPYSFGQTIENLFYVSFLIRDGKVGISVDDRGLPYLDVINEANSHDQKNDQPSKHQAVLALDMAMWRDLIDAFDIKEPMIRHRDEEEHSNVGARGWYA